MTAKNRQTTRWQTPKVNTRSVRDLDAEELKVWRGLWAEKNEASASLQEYATSHNVWLGDYDECKVVLAGVPEWVRYRACFGPIASFKREHNLH